MRLLTLRAVLMLAFLPLLLVLVGCEAKIDVKPSPKVTQAVFDPSAEPPLVPTPTDLAKNPATGLLSEITDPTDPNKGAEREFNAYLRSLNGYPTSAVAEVRFDGEIVGGKIGKDTIPVFEVPATVPGPPVTLDKLVYDFTPKMANGNCGPTCTVRISSPGGWKRGTMYVAVVRGGAKGVQAINNGKTEPVARSGAFELVSSKQPLCAWDANRSWDDTLGGCVLPAAGTGKAIGCCTFNYAAPVESQVRKTVEAEMAGRTYDEIETEVKKQTLKNVTKLELVRRGYTALFSALPLAGVTREEVALLWNFTIHDMTEVLYDPTAGVIPFPNNVLLDPAGLAKSPPVYQVAIPETKGETEQQKKLRLGLNTLDGFTTQGKYYAAVSGKVDPASIKATNAIGFNLEKQQPVAMTFSFVDTAPAIVATPQQPLEEKTMHGIVLVSRIKPGDIKPADGEGSLRDDKGRRLVPAPFMALIRSRAPLSSGGKSTISTLDDATANQLEPVRLAFKLLFDGLEANSLLPIKREEIVAAWTFRTMTITEPLTKLRALPWSIFKAVDSNQPKWTGTFDATLAGFPAWATKTNLGGWVPNGKFTTWNALDEQGTGAFLPDPTKGKPNIAPFILTVPKGAAPASGWPVVLFQHGIFAEKKSALHVADTLAAAGYATLSFDIIYHGERSWCTKDAHCASGGTCTVATGKCSTSLLDTKGQGNPDASGARFFDPTNPFAVRDTMRQHVIDASAFLRGLAVTKLGPVPGAYAGITGFTDKLDAAKVYYLGQSLGSMLGTLVLAVDSLPKVANLNVVGAPVPDVVFSSSLFRDTLVAVLASLKVTPGSLEFLRLTTIYNWVIDPADPGNFAPYLQKKQLPDLVADPTGKVLVPKKAVIVQLAEKDQTVPIRFGRYLAKAADIDTSIVDSKLTYAGQTHGFLTEPSPDANATKAAQAQTVFFFGNPDVSKLCTPNLTAGTCQ